MSFDLCKYASNYTGRIQLDRIGFIRKHNPRHLDVDSVLANCAQRFKNSQFLIRKYTTSDLADENEIAQSAIGSDFFIQNKPITQMRLAFEYGLDKLAWRAADTVLKDLSSNSGVPTKERFGMLLEASIVNLVFESCSNSVSTSQLQECEFILNTHLSDASGKGDATSEDKDVFYPTPSDILRCRVLRALTCLLNQKPLECANTLLHLPQSCIDVPDEKINDIATISDLVMYTVLCSLAKMGREELRRNVIENTNFREWLEHRGCEECKVLLNSFFHCQWKSAWSMLSEVCEKARYDMFISKLVGSLKETIKNKLLLQYCKPYQCVSIEAMSTAFGMKLVDLERVLLRLIDEGVLSARIDGVNHQIVRYTPDARGDAFQRALTAGNAFEDWTERDLFYANLIDGGYLNADVVSEIEAKLQQSIFERHSQQQPPMEFGFMTDEQIAAALQRQELQQYAFNSQAQHNIPRHGSDKHRDRGKFRILF